METYKYGKATINVRGGIDREKLIEATVRFIRKADKCKRNKSKEKNQNDNKNTPRAS